MKTHQITNLFSKLRLSKTTTLLLKLSGQCICLLFFLWFFFFSYNGSYRVSIHRNWVSGETSLNTEGASITPPWVQIIRIDTRPVRACIECSCNNVSCDLVSFNPDGWKEFLEIEGYNYYWSRNRISFNYGHDKEYRGISNILRGYSFSDKNYTFIKKHKQI